MAHPLESMCKHTVDGHAGICYVKGQLPRAKKTGCVVGHAGIPSCHCLIKSHQQKLETHKTSSSRKGHQMTALMKQQYCERIRIIQKFSRCWKFFWLALSTSPVSVCIEPRTCIVESKFDPDFEHTKETMAEDTQALHTGRRANQENSEGTQKDKKTEEGKPVEWLDHRPEAGV